MKRLMYSLAVVVAIAATGTPAHHAGVSEPTHEARGIHGSVLDGLS